MEFKEIGDRKLYFGYKRKEIGEVETMRQIDAIKPTLIGNAWHDEPKVSLDDLPNFSYDWWWARHLLGVDLDPINQGQVGSCVGAGAKGAIQERQCFEIAHDLDAERYRPIALAYGYGCGRHFIGKDQLRGSDGSLGIWQAKSDEIYGALPQDEPGMPAYSEQIAKQYGDQGPPANFVELGKQHTMSGASIPVNSIEDLIRLTSLGIPCTMASMLSFTMLPDPKSGFHEETREGWGHQLRICGVNHKWKIPYCYVGNSWSDVHGHYRDLETDEVVPVGIARVRLEVVAGTKPDRGLRAGDSFGRSGIKGWQQKPLDLQIIQNQIARGAAAESPLEFTVIQ